MFEKAGKLRFKVREGKFFLDFEVVVPEFYPSEKLELKFNETNFDESYAIIFKARADQVIKRLWEGGEPGYLPGLKSDLNKGKIGLQKVKGKDVAEMDKLKMLTVQEMKHDVEFLNASRQLRDMAADGDKHAKKYMRLKLKHEAAYESKMREEEEDLHFQKALREGTAQNINLEAKEHLYHAVNFLTNFFVRFLPTAQCLGCDKKLLGKLKNKSDEMRPERAYCAHWMHYKCFHEYVNTPPFDRKCPYYGCDERFGSKNFKLDEPSVKSREKVYMQAQEKKGEEDDINRLLGII